MSQHLFHELDRLSDRLTALAERTEKAIRNSIDSLFKGDIESAKKIIKEDRKIDQEEVEIEEECLKILALYQPVASDLRFIITILKVNGELERVGDHAKNIAERILDLPVGSIEQIPQTLEEMKEHALSMLRRSIESFTELDLKIVQRIHQDDELVDGLNRSIFVKMKQEVRAHSENLEFGLVIMSVARHLERVADLATNIAEDVEYLIEGEITRHAHHTGSKITSRILKQN